MKIEFDPKAMTRDQLEEALLFCMAHIRALTDLCQTRMKELEEKDKLLRRAVDELEKRLKPPVRTKSAEEEWTDAACAYYNMMRDERGGP